MLLSRIFSLETLSNRKLLVFVGIVHLITAFFSEGFFQFDEHFQILEFLGHKLNGTSANDLPWEYREQIRPWFQVLLYYIILLPLKSLGLTSPFIQATLLRIVTSAFSIASLFYLKDYLPLKEKRQKLVFLVLSLTWFAPMIHVRASSENLSASFIFFGLVLLFKNLKNETIIKGILAGLALGGAYLVKSQLSVAVAFLWFWLVLFNHKAWRTYLGVSLGILITIGLGVVIDYWGYQEWTFTTLNYFKVNILEDRVSGFGIDPWWNYLKYSFMKGIPLLSLPFILGTFYYWYKKPKDPITWLTLPFFLIHCFIGHKELRFIFLVVLLSPYMMIYAAEQLNLLKSSKIRIFVMINFILLTGASFKAANSGIRFYKYLHDEEIKEVKALDEDPMTMVGLKLNFYHPKDLNVQVKKEFAPNETGLLFFKSGSKYFEYSKKKNCSLNYLSYPKFSLKFNIGNWISRSRVWSLWNCTK